MLPFRKRDFVIAILRALLSFINWFLNLISTKLTVDIRLSAVNLVDSDFAGWVPLAAYSDTLDTGFSVNTALSLSILSKMAYETAYTGNRLCRKHGIFQSADDICTEVRANNVCALIFRFDHAVVVAFRGTQPTSLFDYITDLQAARRVVDDSNRRYDDGMRGSVVSDATCANDTVGQLTKQNGRLHHGILSALELEDPKFGHSLYSKLSQELLRLLRDRPDGSPKALYLCGHSLGGALATITSWKLEQENVAIAAIYTIGSPMVGDSDFARVYEKMGLNLHRVVLDDDFIPRLPPSTTVFHDLHRFPFVRWIWGMIGYPLDYVHFGQLVHVVRGGQRKGPMESESTIRFVFRALVRGKLRDIRTSALASEPLIRKGLRLVLPTFLNDHFPGDYVRALRIIQLAKVAPVPARELDMIEDGEEEELWGNEGFRAGGAVPGSPEQPPTPGTHSAIRSVGSMSSLSSTGGGRASGRRHSVIASPVVIEEGEEGPPEDQIMTLPEETLVTFSDYTSSQ